MIKQTSGSFSHHENEEVASEEEDLTEDQLEEHKYNEEEAN